MRKNAAVGVVVVAGLLLVALVVGLVLSLAPDPQVVRPVIDPGRNSEVIARVGSREITRFQLVMKRETERAKAGDKGEVMADFGLLRELVEWAVEEEILKRHGSPITPGMVDEERARIQKETKDAEKLTAIQRICAPYPGMYDVLVVRPILSNNRIHHFQAFDPRIQADVYSKARAMHAAALKDPGLLEREGAGKDPMTYHRHSTKVLPLHLPAGSEEGHARMTREFIKRWLGKVAPGDVSPELIDESGALGIVRLIERDGEDGTYEAYFFRKNPYDAWLRGELKELRLEILDTAHLRELEARGKGNPVIDRILECRDGK